MPMLARYWVISSFSRSVRFSSGTLTIAIETSPIQRSRRRALTSNLVRESAGSPHNLQQELQYFKMPFCLFETLAPSVESVSAQQKTMYVWVLHQLSLEESGQSGHVLIVLYNWQPFAVSVRSDSFQSLQHFVAFDPKAAGIGVML